MYYACTVRVEGLHFTTEFARGHYWEIYYYFFQPFLPKGQSHFEKIIYFFYFIRNKEVVVGYRICPAIS